MNSENVKFQKVDSFNNLAWENRYSDPQLGLEYTTKAYELAIEVGYNKGAGIALNHSATIKLLQGNFESIESEFLQALQIFEKTGNLKLISLCLNNISALYLRESRYSDALVVAQRALGIAEELNDNQGIAHRLRNIANIHYFIGEFDKASKIYHDALKLYDELKMDDLIGLCNYNIGNCNLEKGDPASAIELYLQALEMISDENTGDIAGIQNNLGEAYLELADFRMAQTCLHKAHDIYQAEQKKYELTHTLDGLGKVYSGLNEFEKANKYYHKSCSLAAEINSQDDIRIAYQNLARNYALMGDFESAYQYLEKYQKIHEEIYSHEQTQKIAELQHDYEMEKKEREAEIFRLKNVELVQANDIIRTKNEQITASIRYALRIQQSILPRDSEMQDLPGNHFIFFKPKSIVSGDFYWIKQIESASYFAVVDCTGHGVPGAFMSLIGYLLLNKIVTENPGINPGNLLDLLNRELRQVLRQDQAESLASDGMELGIVKVDLENRILEFAGARRPLLIINQGQQKLIKGTRRGIGGTEKPDLVEFKTERISLQQVMIFYLYSDGFPDQDNPEGKKMGSKTFRNHLKNISSHSCEDQEVQLEKLLNDYQGFQEQRDDITVLGIQLKAKG